MSADALIFAYPTPSVASRHLPLTGGVGPGPLFTGDALLSGPTGGLSIQNLPLLRFMNCAWLCRANASDADYAVGAASSRPKSLPPPRGKVPPKGADEGDLLVRIIYGGSYKGLPTQSETVPLTRKITVGATLAVARCGEAVPSIGAAHLGRPPATGFYSRSSDRPTR